MEGNTALKDKCTLCNINKMLMLQAEHLITETSAVY